MLKDLLALEGLGEQFRLLADCVRRGIPSAAFGVSASEKAHIAALVGKPVLYVAKDRVSAMSTAELMSQIAGEECVYLPPKDDVLLYKHAFNRDSLYRRISALHKMQSGVRLVTTTFEALLQLFPRRVRKLILEKGRQSDVGAAARYLTELGYRREDFAESKGSFSVRGDILDVWPIDSDVPYRIDHWGDEIEDVKRFDPITKDVLSYEQSVTILMASDAWVEPSEIPTLVQTLREEERKHGGDAYARMTARTGELIAGLESGNADCSFLMPLLKNATNDLSGYLPEDAVVVFDEGKMLADGIGALQKEHAERYKNLLAGGEAASFSAGQYAATETVVGALCRRPLLALQNITATIPFFAPLQTFRFTCTPVAKYYRRGASLADDVRGWKAGGYRVYLLAGSSTRAQNVKDMLYENGVIAAVKDYVTIEDKGVVISPETLESGFIYHDVKMVVIGSGDLFTKPANEKRVRRRRNDLFTAPEIGDYAVHETHGIGVVRGTKKITTAEGTKDYIALEYSGGDLLYVPVEQMDVLSRYLGGENKPALSKIGGKDFDRVKERVRASIRAMAIDLKQLYFERSTKKGFAFSPDNELMREFEQAFPYEETPDQALAVAEVKKDMESGKVTDRLICGDVGFGKTEVALRAAFKAVLDGKQVAVLAPTTILSQQHYRTFTDRMKDFGVRVEVLNRFRTEKEQQAVLAGLASGKVDVVVGTHRLVSKDVKFFDLGLLVLDEEQRFGVETKEKLKLLKSNVDTLTLTATPIPRTLNMSLTGIRDISTINTPPLQRIPVQTYVVEESETLIRDAVMRELSRGGQVFLLYNRVETIYHFAKKISEIIPEAKITVAHGRMQEKTLEDGIMDFYHGNSDVLISTTIIENGIDLPRANTLIVIDSDHLGLSTLYQLKGRVGRSNRLAHAYFTFKRDKVLSEPAYKRLSAIMEFTEMGSGFKIAMRDLEIRGAGNVLGKEQHGHMDKIGYELYNKLLREEMGEEVWTDNLELDIRVNAHIPDDYIESSSARLDCYKQIAEIQNEADVARVAGSISENYGEMPEEVENLIVIALLKSLAIRIGASAITVTAKQSSIELASLNKMDNAGLLTALSERPSDCVAAFQEKPLLVFGGQGEDGVCVMRKMIEFLSYAAKENAKTAQKGKD